MGVGDAFVGWVELAPGSGYVFLQPAPGVEICLTYLAISQYALIYPVIDGEKKAMYIEAGLSNPTVLTDRRIFINSSRYLAFYRSSSYVNYYFYSGVQTK